MATQDSSGIAAKNTRKGYSTRKHYTPPQVGELRSGVRKTSKKYDDLYSGEKDELVSMGLLDTSLFPGEPGMPATQVTLWPPGAIWGESWNTPGRMVVTRRANGTFTIKLAVSEQEQERRVEEDCKKTEAYFAKLDAAKPAEDDKPKYASAEAFREAKLLYFSLFGVSALPRDDDSSDYMFDPEVLAKATQKVKEAEYLLQSAKVISKPCANPHTREVRQTNCGTSGKPQRLRLVHSVPVVA